MAQSAHCTYSDTQIGTVGENSQEIPEHTTTKTWQNCERLQEDTVDENGNKTSENWTALVAKAVEYLQQYEQSKTRKTEKYEQVIPTNYESNILTGCEGQDGGQCRDPEIKPLFHRDDEQRTPKNGHAEEDGNAVT